MSAELLCRVTVPGEPIPKGRPRVTRHGARTSGGAGADGVRGTGGAMIWLLGYLGTIVGANWALSTFGVVPVGFGLMAPAGVYFAGVSFSCRDAVQERQGRRWVVAAILAGAVLSAFVSPSLALASGVAFLTSETADFLVYTPLRVNHRYLAVLLSNSVGAVVDSLVFLWLAFGSITYWQGQVLGKWWTVLPVLAFMVFWRNRCRLGIHREYYDGPGLIRCTRCPMTRPGNAYWDYR